MTQPTKLQVGPKYEVPQLTDEEKFRYQLWVEDAVVRSLRKHGYCDQAYEIMTDVFGTSVTGSDSFYASDGRDCEGDPWTDEDGYDADGFNGDGFDRDGFNTEGRDKYGYDRAGLDTDGVARDDPRAYRFNDKGFDALMFNAEGFDPWGRRRVDYGLELALIQQFYNKAGRDRDGYDPSGYDPSGSYDRSHRTKHLERGVILTLAKKWGLTAEGYSWE